MAGNSFAKILAAFDGSSDSVRAAKRASALAKEFSAALTLVHVYSIPAFAYGGPGPMPLVDFSALEDSAKTKAQEVLSRGIEACKDEGVTPTAQTLEASSIVQALVEYAAKNGHDLIVIGTRGMTGFKKLLVGSVSSGVVTHAQCSVLVVR